MVDLTTWDGLLRTYVDADGRGGLPILADGTTDHPRRLAGPATRETKGHQDHLAHWINLYNAFTIQAVLSRYPIASIRPKLLGLPNWIGFLRFFQQPVHRLGSQLFSLAQIENRMLRECGQDPRIHFAIVWCLTGVSTAARRGLHAGAR